VLWVYGEIHSLAVERFREGHGIGGELFRVPKSVEFKEPGRLKVRSELVPENALDFRRKRAGPHLEEVLTSGESHTNLSCN
jgi:hypothetical protein